MSAVSSFGGTIDWPVIGQWLRAEVFTVHFLTLLIIGLGAFVAYLAGAGIHIQFLVTLLTVLGGIEAAVVAVQSAAGTDARTHALRVNRRI